MNIEISPGFIAKLVLDQQLIFAEFGGSSNGIGQGISPFNLRIIIIILLVILIPGAGDTTVVLCFDSALQLQ